MPSVYIIIVFTLLAGSSLLISHILIIVKVSTIHMRNWLSPTRATPTILPVSNSKGLTEEMIISTIRFVFSSSTPLMTIDPYIKTNIYMRKPKSNPRADIISELTVSSDFSLMRMVLKLISEEKACISSISRSVSWEILFSDIRLWILLFF